MRKYGQLMGLLRRHLSEERSLQLLQWVQLLQKPGLRDVADAVITQLGGTPPSGHIHADTATQTRPPNCS